MDYKQLATDIVIFLSPFLPFLVLAGEATVEEVGKKIGEASLEKAKSLWNRVKDTTTETQKLNGVATALAADPTDEDIQFALAKILVKHLEDSPKLADELIKLVKDDANVQKVLVEQGSKVKDIYQRLSDGGRQETVIRDSQAGNITQEQ